MVVYLGKTHLSDSKGNLAPKDEMSVANEVIRLYNPNVAVKEHGTGEGPLTRTDNGNSLVINKPSTCSFKVYKEHSHPADHD